MTVRTIVVPVAAIAEDRAGLLAALAIARVFRAHIDAVFVRPDPEDVFAYMGLVPAVTDRATTEQRARLEAEGSAASERARAQFARLCQDTGIAMADHRRDTAEPSARWLDVAGEPARVIPELAKVHDLAVFTGAFTGYHLLLENALEATLQRSGRPVLFLPETGQTPDLGHALVAWDGAAAAARAVSAWLAAGDIARQATVLRLSETGEDLPHPDGVIDHLGWHGVAAEAEIRARGFGSLGAALVEAAVEAGAGVIVMGGYGHARYREAVFGGVTRHVIRNAPVPVLLMH